MARSNSVGPSFIVMVVLWLAASSASHAQSIQISPGPTVTLDTTTSQQFTATALDKHGVPLSTQPTFIWSVETGAVGSIGYLDGLYHSGSVAGTATIKVTGGGLSSTVAVTVNPTPVTVVDPASATPNPAPLTMTNLSVLGGYAGNGGETALTYTWAE